MNYYIPSKKDCCFVMTSRGIRYGPFYDFLTENPCIECKFNINDECKNKNINQIEDCNDYILYLYGVKCRI